MFSKLLICTDLTPASYALIQCAEALKGIGTKEVVLTYVLEAVNSVELGQVVPTGYEPALARQREMLESQGLRVIVETPIGAPAAALEETAEKHDVGAILIGSHGKGLFQAAALGSVSSDLLKRTKFPLLLDRIDLSEAGEEGLACRTIFNRVLFPTDFSQTAEKAMDYLGKIALETGCSVTLLHVMDRKDEDPVTAKSLEEEFWYLLEAKKRRLERLGAAQVSIDLVYGKPGEEIVERARKGAFTCVVMGGQGRGMLAQIILGSTANEVARHAELPVLFVPAAALE